MWTGQPLKKLPAPVVEKTQRDYRDDHLYKGPTPAQRHFDALKRMLDRKEPDYATQVAVAPAHMRNCASGAGTRNHRCSWLREVVEQLLLIDGPAAYGSRLKAGTTLRNLAI